MIIKIDKNTAWILCILVLIIFGVIITVVMNPGEEEIAKKTANTTLINAGTNVSSDSMIDFEVGDLQTITMGEVTVEVTPVALGSKEEKNIFSVAFNTHSVELDFDFTKIMYLKDDLGNEYHATEWTGNSGWHHVSGDVIFPKINNIATKVTLYVTDIENMTKSFDWLII